MGQQQTMKINKHSESFVMRYALRKGFSNASRSKFKKAQVMNYIILHSIQFLGFINKQRSFSSIFFKNHFIHYEKLM